MARLGGDTEHVVLASSLPQLRDLWLIGLLGSVGIAGFSLAFVAASQLADPAVVGAVLAATPVLLALIGPLMRSLRPASHVLLGAAVVSAGTVVAAGAGAATATGLVLCLIALICEVVFTLAAVPLIARHGTTATTWYAVTAGALALTVAAVVVDSPGTLAMTFRPTDEIAALVYLSLVVSLAANLSWYAAVPMLGADQAGLFYAFSPIGALLGGLFLGTSSVGVGELAGFAIVIAGLVVGLRRRALVTTESKRRGTRRVRLGQAP